MKFSSLLLTSVVGSMVTAANAGQLRSHLPQPEITTPLDQHGRYLQGDDGIPSECQALFNAGDTCVENNLPDCTTCPSDSGDPSDVGTF